MALNGTTEVVSRTATSAFLPGKVAYITLSLDSACVSVPCQGGLTCARGQCVPSAVVPTLTRDGGAADPRDATAAPDADGGTAATGGDARAVQPDADARNDAEAGMGTGDADSPDAVAKAEDAPLAQLIVDETDRVRRLVDRMEAFSDDALPSPSGRATCAGATPPRRAARRRRRSRGRGCRGR